jgi:preprotein translocase subunit YajC
LKKQNHYVDWLLKAKKEAFMRILIILSSIFLLNTYALAAEGQAVGSGWSSLIMLLAFVAIFYFLLLRPQMKRNKEHKKLLSEISKGDEVLTSAGIVGKIVHVGDNFVELSIAEGVEIKVQKQSVSSLLPKGSIKSSG